MFLLSRIAIVLAVTFFVGVWFFIAKVTSEKTNDTEQVSVAPKPVVKKEEKTKEETPTPKATSAYTSLYRINYDTSASSTEEEGDLLAIIDEELKPKAGLLSDFSSIPKADSYDLNGDGEAEIFVHLGTAYCGSGGCSNRIYRQSESSEDWRLLSEIQTYTIDVLTTRTNGYHDLLVSLHGSAADKPGVQTQQAVMHADASGKYTLDTSTISDYVAPATSQ